MTVAARSVVIVANCGKICVHNAQIIVVFTILSDLRQFDRHVIVFVVVDGI